MPRAPREHEEWLESAPGLTATAANDLCVRRHLTEIRSIHLDTRTEECSLMLIMTSVQNKTLVKANTGACRLNNRRSSYPASRESGSRRLQPTLRSILDSRLYPGHADAERLAPTPKIYFRKFLSKFGGRRKTTARSEAAPKHGSLILRAAGQSTKYVLSVEWKRASC